MGLSALSYGLGFCRLSAEWGDIRSFNSYGGIYEQSIEMDH